MSERTETAAATEGMAAPRPAEKTPPAREAALPKPPDKSLPELIAELLEMLARFVREQAAETLQKSVVTPLQKLGGYLGLGIVASTLVAVGAIFIAIGLFQLLAVIVGSSWAAFLIVGAASMIIAVVLVLVRMRFKQ